MLETQMLEIKMVGSLAQEVDARVLQPGSWLALDNVQVDKIGAWTKRTGFSFLGYPTNIAPGASVVPRYLEAIFPQVDGPRLQTPWGVGAVGPMLYSSWLEQGDDPRPPLIATWTDDTFGWEAKDTRPPFVLTRTCEVRSSHELVAAACVVLDGILWSAYKASDPTNPRVYLRGTSLETGDVVQDDVYFFTLWESDAPFALVATAGRVVAVYVLEVDPEPLFAYVQADYLPSTREINRDVVLNGAPSDSTLLHFSICAHPTDSSVYYLAIAVAGGLNVQLSTRAPATPGTPVTSAVYDPSGTLAGLAICALSTTALPAGSCFVSYALSSPATYVVGFENPTFTQSWSATLIDGVAWTRLDNIAVRNGSGGEDQVITSGVIEGAADVFDRIWYQPASALNGNYLAAPYFVAGAGAVPAARAFSWRGKAYLPIVVREPGASGYENLHGAIYHLAATNGFEPYRAPLVGCWAVDRFATFGRFGGSVLNPPALLTDEPAPSWALLAPSRAGLSQTQIDRIIIEAPADNTALLPAAQAQGLAYLPGALTTVFDGQRCFEAGFLAKPVTGDPDEVPDEGSVAPGTYLYLFEWEHFDAKGNRHTSPVSDVITVEVETEDKDLIFEVLTETYTRRADVDDARDNAARLVVYRTTKDSAGPFYRITTPVALTFDAGIGAPFAPLANDATADTITFTDDLDDNDLLALGFGFYTGNLAGAIPGAIQDPGSVPPSKFLLNHKQRLFGISGDDPRTIFYSRFFVASEAPAFPPPFVIYLSDTDEAATALGALGDKLLIFTANRIYYVYGEGPDDAGGGAGFSEPTLCSDAIGCVEPRSIAVTPVGLVFQASDDGIYVIDGGLSPQRVSGAVEDYLARSQVKSVHVDTARGCVVWALTETIDDADQSTLLVFWYWTSTWTRWVIDPTEAKGNAGACLWQGQHVVAEHYEAASSTFGMVAVESTDRRDRSTNALVETSRVANYHGVIPRIQTPWLRLAGLNGFQRARRFQLRGLTNGSIGVGGEITVTVQHDEEDFGGQVFTYDLSTVTRLPVLALGGHIARQKCASVRVTVDVEDEGGGVGTTLTALTLELGGLKGFTKLPRTNKGAANGGGS